MGWKVDELEGVPNNINQHGEKIECFMQGTRDYVKFLKRGYSRVSQINSLNVRNKRISPDEAKEINEKHDEENHPRLIFFRICGIIRKRI